MSGHSKLQYSGQISPKLNIVVKMLFMVEN